MRPFRHIISWLLALCLIAFFVHFTVHPLPDPPTGWVKFFDPPGQNVVFQTLADRTGTSAFEPAGRMVAGLLELVAVVMLLVPVTRRAGALLSGLILATGAALHLSPWLGREIPLEIGSTATDGGFHFILVIVFLAASLLLLVAHPASLKPR